MLRLFFIGFFIFLFGFMIGYLVSCLCGSIAYSDYKQNKIFNECDKIKRRTYEDSNYTLD